MIGPSTKSERRFRRFGILTIASVFFLIFVGGLVRSTGSGMGCPDWPTCFGKWVPPTHVSELPENYKELFKTAQHEVAEFDAYKTWTEYINRLIGVTTGLFVFFTVIFAIPYLKSKPIIFWLSLLAFLLTGFQGWIGAKVVDTNLANWMVTIHMVIALIIVGLLIYTITQSQDFVVVQATGNRSLKVLMVLLLVVSAIQTISGTQVRENVDAVALVTGEQNRAHWVSLLGNVFQFHRTFSLVSVVLTLTLAWKLKLLFDRHSIIYKAGLALLLTLSVQILTGKILDVFGFPKHMQSMHLFFGSVICGLQLLIAIVLFNKTKLKALVPN